MQYYTYIIKSKTFGRYYIGSCQDLTLRVERHNSGNSKSTKAFIPWEIVYFEEFDTKSEAIKRELYIKKQKSKNFIETLIHSRGRPD
jgi:putative endonuclease